MHEIGVAAAILDAVAEKNDGRRVIRVVVEIGRLTAVLPDALRFCFDVASRGTRAEGATLDIVETDVAIHCRSCGYDGPGDPRFAMCACGSADVAVLRGSELHLREMEVA